MVKKLLAVLLACALLLSVAGCAGAPTPAATPAPAAATEAPAAATEAPVAATEAPAAAGMKVEDIKCGFVYVGPATDGGWSQGHDEGRQALEKALGVKTLIAESVPENADCEKAIRNLIDQGCNVIFTTSFGFMDWTENVAKEFPDVKFFHCSGYKMADNFSNYFGRMYQARYLSGIAAGLKTASGKIGYVAAFPIPELVRGINAFTLGVRSVNPKATVEVIWTNTWFDPAVEKAAALELLNKGCDVMAQHQDSTATQLAAEEKGAFSVGYDISSPNVAPKAYLTAPIWHWSVYYIDQVQKIIDGTWAASSYWAPMKDGIVSLDTLSALCAEGTQAKVDEAKAKILSGEWDVFYGPLKDNTGAEKVAEGAKMTDAEMLSFDWFVEGVIGSIPKS